MKWLVAVFSWAALTACSGKPLLEEPRVQIKDITVSSLNFDGGTLQLACEVENPNAVDLTIDKLNYSLSLNSKKITTSETSSPTRLPAKEKVLVNLPVKFKFSDVFSGLSSLLENKPVSYSVEGSAKLGIFTIPFNKSGQLDLKK